MTHFTVATWRRFILFSAFAGLLIAISAGAAEDEKRKEAKSEAPPAAEKFTMSGLAAADVDVLTKLRKPATVQWKDVPLAKALAELKEACGVPISVDEAGLKKARVSIAPTVSGEWEKKPVEEILAALLRPPQLDYIVKDKQVLIVSANRSLQALFVTVTYDVRPLCPDNASLQGRLQRAIHKGSDEDDWEDTGGFASLKSDPAKRTLTIKHTWSKQAAFRNIMREFVAAK